MRLDRTAASTLAALLTLATVAWSAPDGWTTRRYGVRDLRVDRALDLQPERPGAGLFLAYQSQFAYSEVYAYPSDFGNTHDFNAGEIATIVGGFLDEVDEEGSVDEQDGRLVVRTTPAGHERVEDTLTVLRRALGRRAVVDVEEILLPPDAVSGAAADLGAWRESDVRGAPRRLTLSAALGAWRSADALITRTAVVDLDVEIAEGASIADPVVRRVSEGLRVLARPVPLTDGRVLLRIIASAADLRGEPRRMTLGQDELGAVELPDLDAAFVSTELLLEAGRPRVVTVARPGGARRVLVFTLRDAPWAPVGGTLRVFPHGGLSAPAPAVVFGVGEETGDPVSPWLSVLEDESDTGRRMDGDEVHDELAFVVAEQVDEGTAEIDGVGWLLGGAMVARGTEPDLARVHDRLRELEQALIRHADVSIRIEERRDGGADAGGVAALASQVALDTRVALAAYRSTGYVADFEVEVAQHSKIADPIVRTATAGAVANLRVSEAEAGTYAVTLELRVAAFDGPDAVPVGATDVGTRERVLERTVYAQRDLLVRKGRPVDVELGPSPSGEPGVRLVAVLTVE